MVDQILILLLFSMHITQASVIILLNRLPELIFKLLQTYEQEYL